jgi:WS/DGAT/MGAT family acyltransferase
VNPDRLGAVDETYLTVEGPGTPMQVGSIGIFEAAGLCDRRGRLRLAEVRERIAARLGLLPRLRQRLAEVPFGVNRPVWVDDEAFDIAHHVDAVPLGPPYDEAALLRLAEQIAVEPLDRTRPLWHLRFVTGLDGDRVALIERAHHALIDGVSGVDVSLVLLDTTPDAPAGSFERWTPRRAPTPGELFVGGVADRWTAPFELAARATRALFHPVTFTRGAADVANALAALRRDGVRAPECSLNRALGSTRELIVVREQLEAVRKAGAPAGATVNDVVLAAVGGGLRDLFLARGESLPPDRTVKVLIPVSLRTGSQSAALGNRVGGLLLSLPIGIGDPGERLRGVIAATRALKASREATTADLLLQAANLLPPSVAHVVQRGVNRQPLVNLVVTNVPGPDFPLYALGSRMLEAFPVVPLGAQMTLEVAVLSYDGALNLCVTADRTACADAEVFAGGLRRGFESLHAHWTPVVT